MLVKQEPCDSHAARQRHAWAHVDLAVMAGARAAGALVEKATELVERAAELVDWESQAMHWADSVSN